ncbi:beta-N-acetylhexosaminidase [Tissierella sp.]|uniref:beta-N-acetylhexosaminidase n=1 Tax=Tissierella sp. TaxID=41274 RepID=UPI0028576A32|nr:beta-N-acetylhexosaminidase [Tissierella sp.]MDR7857268.1 beta-N-acetylhexosaminidase [Tissierella sp.]
MTYKKSVIILFILSCFLFVGCQEKSLDEDNNSSKDDIGHIENDHMVPIDDRIKSMSIEEKIGQLIVVGFDGSSINEEAIEFIEDLKVGGFILFSRNIIDENSVLGLLNNLKEANSNNDIPLLLSIDEEGGMVSRLPKSFVKLPDAMTVGNKNDEEISYGFGKMLGDRVKALGFNTNFAPVLDINSNPNNPVIGNRAFGTEVNQVVSSGIQVMKGIRESGVIPAVKHFPGHGDTNIDSHINLPIVRKDMDELKFFELLPFISAIEEDVEMIMVAHILYPEIDKDYPATMSFEVIQRTLRDELGYDGVIVSDDMTMGAIVKNYTLEDGVLQFIKSGGDIALICHGKDNPRKAVEKIADAVNSGELSEEDIDKKVYRILKLKDKFNLEDSVIDKLDLQEINHNTTKLIDEINR